MSHLRAFLAELRLLPRMWRQGVRSARIEIETERKLKDGSYGKDWTSGYQPANPTASGGTR